MFSTFRSWLSQQFRNKAFHKYFLECFLADLGIFFSIFYFLHFYSFLHSNLTWILFKSSSCFLEKHVVYFLFLLHNFLKSFVVTFVDRLLLPFLVIFALCRLIQKVSRLIVSFSKPVLHFTTLEGIHTALEHSYIFLSFLTLLEQLAAISVESFGWFSNFNLVMMFLVNPEISFWYLWVNFCMGFLCFWFHDEVYNIIFFISWYYIVIFGDSFVEGIFDGIWKSANRATCSERTSSNFDVFLTKFLLGMLSLWRFEISSYFFLQILPVYILAFRYICASSVGYHQTNGPFRDGKVNDLSMLVIEQSRDSNWFIAFQDSWFLFWQILFHVFAPNV